MSSGFQNFLKVFSAALGRPIPILTIALGVLMALFLPTTAIYLIPLSLIMSLVAAWTDTNNPDFITSVLNQSNPKLKQSSLNTIKSLSDLLNLQISKTTFEEVKIDLNKAKQNLAKIQDILNYLDSQGQSFDSFVLESLGKMVTQLIDLSKQEELARKFLKNEDQNQAILELNDLKNQIAKITDVVAKKEYEKVIHTKENQLHLVQSVSQRLERIDSYLARILSSMEQSYSYLTKLGLKDKQELIDESEVLTSSLESVVSDIDRFESEMFEVGERIDHDVKSYEIDKIKL